MSEGTPTGMNDLTPPPPPPPLSFPEYGQGGDYAGQRRARRSFRYAVIAVVAFVAAMRVYEGYAKLDLRESQYAMSLTLPDASARPILRNIVKRETEASGQPTPMYTEALAGVEEDELMLAAYESAARLAPNNPALLMKYGCVLFQKQQFDVAREKFREAGVHPPRNALPNYLEAAALASGLKPGADLSEAMALVARANNSAAPLLFPVPQWHATLPRAGEYYANRRRDLARKLCAPLSQFKELVMARAAHDLAAGTVGDWAQWLVKLQDMGHRIATARGENDEIESTQVMAGINIEMGALQLRQELATKTGNGEDFTERLTKLSEAMKQLGDFENQRQAGIEASRVEVKRPFRFALQAMGATLALYLLVWVMGFLLGADQRSVALSHSRLGVAGILLGICTVGVALHVLSLLRFGPDVAAQAQAGALGLLGVVLVFGAVYPLLSLPGVAAVLAGRGLIGLGQSEPEVKRAAQRARRNACTALARRYFGALLGGMVVALALWFISFRLSEGIYPHQTDLLVSGMETLERETIARALSGL